VYRIINITTILAQKSNIYIHNRISQCTMFKNNILICDVAKTMQNNNNK